MKLVKIFFGSFLFPLIVSAQIVSAVPDNSILQRSFGKWDAEAFRNPNRQFYPETWFHFVNGNVERKGVSQDLKAISEAGITGISFFYAEQGGEKWPGAEERVYCLTPEWEDLVKFTADEAHKYGLRFSIQTCPGWAMSGGPWVTPEQAMRHVVYSRQDVEGGQKVRLPQNVTEDWRNYQDIEVLAFPTPLGDTGKPIRVAQVEAQQDGERWKKLLNAETADGISLSPKTKELPNSVEFVVTGNEVPRSLELAGTSTMNHGECIDLKLHIRMVALTQDGEKEVLNTMMPCGNWQDNTYTTTFALAEVPSTRYRLEFAGEYGIYMNHVRLYGAAKKNGYEGEAAFALRQIIRNKQYPQQNKKCYVEQSSIQNLSGLMQPDGSLQWDVPQGKWTILRIGHVNTGRKNGPAPAEATGWEVNKFDPALVDFQFNSYIGKLATGVLKGKIDNMLMDSWECEAQTWTNGMEKLFKDYAGYDLQKWMPALFGYVVDNPERTAEFLCDWRQLINHLFVHNFYGKMTENAHKLGMSATYETAAGDIFPGDPMEYYKWADVPMTEFWQPFHHFLSDHNFKPIRPTASAAHLYGKPRVSAESFTSFDLNWDEHLSMLREVANQNIVEGMTHFVFHTYTHNPKAEQYVPGTSFGSAIGTPFLRNQTWWRFMPVFTRYLARCTYMLERGKPVSSVLWYIGDEVEQKPDQYFAFPQGYVYDYCNRDALLTRLDVKNGKWTTPDGICYDVMWWPESNERMLPETLERIHQLVKKGGKLIASAPRNPATLRAGSEERFKQAVQAIWGGDTGKGTVLSGISLQEGLNQMGIEPDVMPTQPRWIHRKTENADWYLVVAPEESDFEGEMNFNCQGGVEIWNPMTGKSENAAASYQNHRTIVPMKLERGECKIVVFSHQKKLQKIKPVEQTTVSLANQNWTVNFPQGWGIEPTIQTNELKPWRELTEQAEGKAFSGTATYETKLQMKDLKRGEKQILHLGRVEEIAVVKINGQVADTLWAAPYECDITRWVKPGMNVLQVEVTSTWRNRLVYDAALPEAQRRTWVIAGPNAQSPLCDYGLLGPVSLIKRK